MFLLLKTAASAVVSGLTSNLLNDKSASLSEGCQDAGHNRNPAGDAKDAALRKRRWIRSLEKDVQINLCLLAHPVHI